ncbi:MAG: putative thiosulfate sulfurtransferase [Acidimicrobiaceae bacterium]|nr:putative thiosulfate sulfurtransferase [Acidimicrobiaceae bacterium]
MAHPLFATSLPFDRLELEAYDRIPHREVPIVVCDTGGSVALHATEGLLALGSRDIALLEDGVRGRADAGFELFSDVNSPSKAFGELVAQRCGTPRVSARQLREALERGDDLVAADVRRCDEYATMNIPGAISLPGASLSCARALGRTDHGRSGQLRRTDERFLAGTSASLGRRTDT